MQDVLVTINLGGRKMSDRWKYSCYGTPQEKAARDTRLQTIDDWWKAFDAKSSELLDVLGRRSEWDLPSWMNSHLHKIDNGLNWEFASGLASSKPRLVITPRYAYHKRPLVKSIIERAPGSGDWEFSAYRPAESVLETIQAVEGRTCGSVVDAKVSVSQGDYHLVDLCYHSHLHTAKNRKEATRAAEVATETLLGEECMSKWIGKIKARPLPKRAKQKARSDHPKTRTPRPIPLDRVKDTVDALINSIRSQLPPQPRREWAERADLAEIGFDPKRKPDYIGRRDIGVLRTSDPDVTDAFGVAVPFCSERFSRCGETFCYLMIDESGRDPGTLLGRVEKVFKILYDVLQPNHLGARTGWALGLRYSYYDVALEDLDRAIPALRTALQNASVPKRSWILFYDSDLAAEWVGIYDDSPPPLMPNFDS